MSYSLYNLLKESNYYNVKKQVVQLGKDSPEAKKLMTENINLRARILDEKPIEVIVSILDEAINDYPDMAYNLLATNNEKIIRASIVMEMLNGNRIQDIAGKIDYVVNYSLKTIEYNGLPSDKDKENVMRNCEKRLRFLSDYINRNNLEEIAKRSYEDFESFAKGLKNVQDEIFSVSDFGIYPTRTTLINNIFLNNNVSIEALSSVYNDVLLKNKNLQSFSFSKILERRKELVGKIKGLYRHCEDRFFESLCGKKTKKDSYDLIKSVIELNKDDTDGVRLFFSEILAHTKKRRIQNRLKRLDGFSEFSNSELIYEEAVEKLLNGKSDIDVDILGKLGSHESFLKNYDLFLDRFMNSDDEEYQTALILPLIRGIAETQKRKYKLDFTISYKSQRVSDTNKGTYNSGSGIFYLKKEFIRKYKDKKMALASMVRTTYHEIKHSRQTKKINSDSSLNYNNLLFAIDCILKDEVGSSYYNSNYRYLSRERDAEESAYVETMTYFDKYKDMQAQIQKNEAYLCFLPDYIRKETSYGQDRYMGVIQAFLEYAERIQQNPKIKEKDKDSFIFRFGVIRQFFEKDKNGKIVPKSKEYFDRKEKLFKLMPNCQKKREALYSIKAFRYALEVSKYLSNVAVRDEEYRLYNNEVVKEVVENVGPAPSR